MDGVGQIFTEAWLKPHMSAARCLRGFFVLDGIFFESYFSQWFSAVNRHRHDWVKDKAMGGRWDPDVELWYIPKGRSRDRSWKSI